MYPTTFPAESMRKIGLAVAARQFHKGLFEDAYAVQGYAMYMAFGSQSEGLGATADFGSGPHIPDEGIGDAMVEAADSYESNEGFRAVPLPWAKILKVVLSLIVTALGDESRPSV